MNYNNNGLQFKKCIYKTSRRVSISSSGSKRVAITSSNIYRERARFFSYVSDTIN